MIVVKHLVGGHAGQHRGRIEAEVAQKLLPHVAADVSRRLGLEAGFGQRGGQCGDARGDSIGGLTQHQSIAGIVAHHTRRRNVGRKEDDTAKHSRGLDGRGDPAVGVAGRQGRAGQCATPIVEKPPGQAVERGDHAGVRPQQRRDAGRCPRQAVALERDDHRVLRAKIGRIVAGGEFEDMAGVAAAQCQAVGANRRQVRAARDQADLMAGLGQARTDGAADGAGAENANAHQRVRSNCRKGGFLGASAGLTMPLPGMVSAV